MMPDSDTCGHLGSIGISLASALVTRREQFHQTRIVEHLHPLDPAFASFSAQLADALGTATSAMESLARVFQLAMEQILLFSYLDAFMFSVVVFLCLLQLLFFIKPGAASSGGGAA